MKHWYLIMSKPKQDEVACLNLSAQNYKVYRPLCRVTKKRRNKPVEVIESLFPGYVFIQLDDQGQNWSPIRSTKGVLKLVHFGAQPARVDQTLIDALKHQEQQRLDAPLEPTFNKGDRLRIEQGPLFGLEGVFDHYDSQSRIIMLLNLLGQPQRLCLPPDQVAKS